MLTIYFLCTIAIEAGSLNLDLYQSLVPTTVSKPLSCPLDTSSLSRAPSTVYREHDDILNDVMEVDAVSAKCCKVEFLLLETPDDIAISTPDSLQKDSVSLSFHSCLYLLCYEAALPSTGSAFV